MAEAESMDNRQTPAATTKQNSASGAHHLDEEDDLDALIAEAEVQDRSGGHSVEKSGGNTTSNDKGHDFADEEEAMQEMDGLW
jgi:replication fork protection complex subunit Csm3/Swi3